MNGISTQEVKISVGIFGYIAYLKRWVTSIQEAILNRVNICLLIAGVIYWLFKPFFEQLFLHYWVEQFLIYFQNGVLTQTVALAFIVGIFIKSGRDCRNRKRISEIQLYRWILLTAIWFMVRFSEAWNFIPLMGNITYFDIIPFYSFSVVLVYGAQLIKRKSSEEIEEDGFECDEPIVTSEEDMIGRNEFACTLARRLLKTQSSRQSFAVGILSPWGYGKTSFLNLIKYELKRYEAICIDFSPWSYGKENDFIREFFTEMGTELRRYADTLPRDMMEYARILEKSESTSWFSILLSLGNTAYSLEQQGNLLKQSLQKIDRPIVVFIDDLDRLGGNEVMEVLKLIRNVANFPGLKFVAAYDRAYLVEAIKKQNVESANSYLEKIFQIEYTLPTFEREKLEIYLKKECEKFVRTEDQNFLKKIFYSKNRLEGIVLEELVTLRDVKRYINSLKTSYKKLADNVVLRDLMNLEILRLKYKPVYNLLSRQWGQILTYKDGTLKLYETKEDSDEGRDIMKYLKMPPYEIGTQLSTMGYSEIEINRVLRIFKFLFPPFRRSAEYGAINNKDSIARYFYDTINDKDLPIEAFKGLWQKRYKYIKEEVDNIMSRNQTLSFVNQLDSFNPDSVEVCKKVIRIIFYVGSSHSHIKSSYHIIFNKINLLEHYPNKDVRIKNCLLNVIKENGLSNYISDFLFSEYSLLREYFSFQEIKEIETNYLEEAIRQDLSLNMIYDYMGRATHKGRDYEMNERANNLFKSYVGKHIEEFLQSLVSYMRPSRGYYSVSPFAAAVWGSWADFQEYVQSISPRTPVIEEFTLFLDTYLKKGTGAAVTYKFKHITIERE